MPASVVQAPNGSICSPQHRSTTPSAPLVRHSLGQHQAQDLNEKTSLRSSFLQKSQGRPGQCYEPVNKLGEGAFGVAHLVRDRRTSILRVLKTINKRQAQVPHGQLEKEIRNLKACDHPHIIRLFEYYEDYENIYLLMEHAEGGELHQVLEQQKLKNLVLPERWVSIVLRQSLMAISYVHSQGIIHKDLKSENILLLHVSDVNDPQAQPHAVIIDLGIAELFSARLGRRARCTVVAGTPTHMAPEVWRGNFGPVADVWSLGVVMFELLSGEIPFLCSSLNSAQEWLRMHRQGPNWSLLGHTSSQARAINQRMLNWDERMRPTAQQCLGHSWFKEDNGGVVEAGEVEDMAVEDPAAASSAAPPPLTARAQSSEAVVQAMDDYMGRSRFEKAVLLQVASQLHTSQMARIYEVFVSADRDQNGTLSRDELVGALLQIGVNRDVAESYAECADADRNGSVEYTELATSCIGMLYADLRGMLWQSFCVFDLDGNGVLSKNEIQAVVARSELAPHGFPGNSSMSSVAEAVARMDADGNGLVSFDELCRIFLPRPNLTPVPAIQQQDGLCGGAAVQAVDERPRRTAMQDEEFAQLLDEIEADHGASSASLPPPSGLAGARGAPPGSGVASAGRGQPIVFGSPYIETPSPTPMWLPGLPRGPGALPEAPSPCLGFSMTGLDLSGDLSGVDLDAAAAGRASAAPAPLPPLPVQGQLTPDAHGCMSVDEELSRLLADVAGDH